MLKRRWRSRVLFYKRTGTSCGEAPAAVAAPRLAELCVSGFSFLNVKLIFSMFHRVRVEGGGLSIRRGPETVTDELMALSSGNIHYSAAACRGGGEIRDTQLPPRGGGVEGTRVLLSIISRCELGPGDEISAMGVKGEGN